MICHDCGKEIKPEDVAYEARGRQYNDNDDLLVASKSREAGEKGVES